MRKCSFNFILDSHKTKSNSTIINAPHTVLKVMYWGSDGLCEGRRDQRRIAKLQLTSLLPLSLSWIPPIFAVKREREQSSWPEMRYWIMIWSRRAAPAPSGVGMSFGLGFTRALSDHLASPRLSSPLILCYQLKVPEIEVHVLICFHFRSNLCNPASPNVVSVPFRRKSCSSRKTSKIHVFRVISQ